MTAHFTPTIKLKTKKTLVTILKALMFLLFLAAFTGLFFKNRQTSEINKSQIVQIQQKTNDQLNLLTQLASTSATIERLLSEDQRVRNDKLEATVSAIQRTYTESIRLYEEILDLRGDKADTQKIEEKLANSISQLAVQNYSSASATLKTVATEIKALQQKLAETAVAPTPQAAVSNTAPNSGYSRQKVETDIGGFVVSLIAADLGSTKVIVDTASGGDCGNECPVLSRSD